MPSSAYLLLSKARTFLPLNGKILKLVGRLSLPGLCYQKDLKIVPTIFGNQLAKELETWKKENPGGLVLQYVDDFFPATETTEKCMELTISLLNLLDQGGYEVFWEKAQIVRQQVTYLGFEIIPGQWKLGTDRKEAICQEPLPATARDLTA